LGARARAVTFETVVVLDGASEAVREDAALAAAYVQLERPTSG
jgi:hypothetical protein